MSAGCLVSAVSLADCWATKNNIIYLNTDSRGGEIETCVLKPPRFNKWRRRKSPQPTASKSAKCDLVQPSRPHSPHLRSPPLPLPGLPGFWSRSGVAVSRETRWCCSRRATCCMEAGTLLKKTHKCFFVCVCVCELGCENSMIMCMFLFSVQLGCSFTLCCLQVLFLLFKFTFYFPDKFYEEGAGFDPFLFGLHWTCTMKPPPLPSLFPPPTSPPQARGGTSVNTVSKFPDNKRPADHAPLSLVAAWWAGPVPYSHLLLRAAWIRRAEHIRRKKKNRLIIYACIAQNCL